MEVERSGQAMDTNVRVSNVVDVGSRTATEGRRESVKGKSQWERKKDWKNVIRQLYSIEIVFDVYC